MNTKNETTYKTARTLQPYKVKAFGYDITVPAGSLVSNKTACGNDDTYRFWQDWQKLAEELTGYKNSILAHDLTHYGLNIPADFCEPYQLEPAYLADRLHNQEFKITWSETNLRYLAGEPDSEKKRLAVKTNQDGIAEARAEIARLTAGAAT